ncbi:pirin family protein [Niabella terrae]
MEKKIERIVSRPGHAGMVGDGFRVYNYIPRAGISQERMSPFLVLDFAAAFRFEPTDQPRGVDVHPHKGFETVTIAYQGSVAHQDSAGNSGVIHPGEVQWMTAGSGILHKEFHEREWAARGGFFEMVQLWVNLPRKDKNVTPHYQALTTETIPQVTLPDGGGRVRVIAGAFDGQKGPAETYTPIDLWDIQLKADHRLSADIPAAHHTGLLVIDGRIQVNGQEAAPHSFVLFRQEGETIEITADTDAVILLMSGLPIQEPIVSHGPFVMNSKEEIFEAISDYQAGKFGRIE